MSEFPLDRARAGDENAFEASVEPYLRELHLHCYRMLGSLLDAEDFMQETLASAWMGLGSFNGRSSPRAWLYRIATNRCLNAIRHAKRHAPPEPVPPFDPPEPSRRGDVTWLQPYPDDWLEQAPDWAPGPEAQYETRETVELAFIAALQRLPARQTAALVLCDVLGFSLDETAGMLDTSPTAIKGVLQRARASVARQRSTTASTAPPEPGSSEEQQLVHRFANAFVANDIDAVVALLTDDAWLAMPPAPHEYAGREAIRAFLLASGGWRGSRQVQLRPTRANGQPAFGHYLGRRGVLPAEPTGLIVLTLAGHTIARITRFLDPRLPSMFDVD